jgi:hypothetical protein
VATGALPDTGDVPIVLGGDCSILLGTMLALRRRGSAGRRVGVSGGPARNTTRSSCSPVTVFNVALRSATMAADRASLGSLLSIRAVFINRTRADSFRGTSTTCSPAPTSCWSNIAPIPVAPSIAQVRGSNAAAAHSSSQAR